MSNRLDARVNMRALVYPALQSQRLARNGHRRSADIAMFRSRGIITVIHAFLLCSQLFHRHIFQRI